MIEQSKKEIKALFVEDDPDQVMMYLTKFLIEGVLAIATDNEYDALEYLHNEHFDIILLDVLLRHENGLDILKRIKQDEKTKNIPVIIFTNYAKKEIEDRAKELGAVDFIVKSEVIPKQVAERIKEIVGSIKS